MDIIINLFSKLGVNSTIIPMAIIFSLTYIICHFIAFKKLSLITVLRDKRTVGRQKQIEKKNQLKKELQEKLELELIDTKKQGQEKYLSIKNEALNSQKKTLAEAKEQAIKKVSDSRDQAKKMVGQEIEKAQVMIDPLSQLMIQKLSEKSTTKNDASLKNNVRTGV